MKLVATTATVSAAAAVVVIAGMVTSTLFDRVQLQAGLLPYEFFHLVEIGLVTGAAIWVARAAMTETWRAMK
jgi:hypothetical protein